MATARATDGAGRRTGRMQLRSWWTWIALPWRSPSVALALVGSLCLPALLLASGPMFRRSAADAITSRVVDELEPGAAGLVVSAVGTLDGERVGALTMPLERRLAAIDALAAPVRTLLSDELAVSEEGGRPDPRREVRLVARAGAADAVELVEGQRDAAGVLVPQEWAAERGIGPGDRVVIGSGAAVEVTGVYRDLWSDELDDYWRAVPPDAVPRYLRVFAGPSFHLFIADDELMGRLAPSGRVRWDAALADQPSTAGALRELTAAYRGIDADLARTTDVGDAYRAFAVEPDAPASTFTALFDAEDRARTLTADLEQPVRVATIGGVVTGVVLSTLGALFLLRRYRTTQRLMAADGDAAWRFFGRAIAQYALPALVGAVIGVAAAWAAIRLLGPSGTAELEVVPWQDVALVSVLSCLVAGLVTAAVAVRLTDALDVDVGAIGTTWLSLLVGSVVAMWIAVGADTGGGADPLVVAFPLVAVLAGVVVTVVVLRLVLRSLRRTGGRLPTPLFLAWRALTASATGALTLTAAMGLATGLAMLSVGFVTSIDRATELKAVTVAGAQSRLDTIDRVDPSVLPADSTIVRTLTTRVGGATVDVLAIDPTTFADVVEWPSAFGGSAEELVERLAADGVDAPDAVPAVAVAGAADALPGRGEFGLQRAFPYDVVGTVASAPLASDAHATLLVRTDVLDDVARARRDAAGAEATELGSSLDGFGNVVLSRGPAVELQALADDADWRAAEVRSIDEIVGDVSTQSVRWAFDYLGILAVIAGVVALASTAFYLAERRASREVSTVMTEQMGISARTNVVAAVVEMLGLVVVAVVAGVVAAIVAARRVFPAFEPLPDVPPTVELTVDAGPVVALVLAVATVVAVIAAFSQRSASAAQKASVLRG